MGIAQVLLIFGEKRRIIHLADVVIKRRYPHQFGIAADGVGRLLGQIAHLKRMLVGSRGFAQEPLQKRLVGLAEFEQFQRGRQVEQLRNEIHTDDGSRRHQRAVKQAEKDQRHRIGDLIGRRGVEVKNRHDAGVAHCDHQPGKEITVQPFGPAQG